MCCVVAGCSGPSPGCLLPSSPGLRPVGRWISSITFFRAVKPRVLWRLVYLVPVVAGCGCSWRWWSWWVSGAQAASCSAGVRIPMAEWGRIVLNQWTHSAVASTGGIDVLPGALVTDELSLVQGVQRLSQSEAARSLPWTPPRRLPRSRPEPARSGWLGTGRRGRSGAPGQRDQPRCVFVDTWPS